MAAATLERLEWQAIEHEHWRVDPQRLAAAEVAQEWVDEWRKRSGAD
jgi:hypothetical protein